MSEQIEGRNAVMEAFRAGRPVDKLYVLDGYIGDAAYEMVIRSILVMQGNCPVGAFHQRASRLVKAPTQSKMMECIEPILTEEEAHVYKRGRNAHSSTTAKNASVIEYRRATGFEAVMGYLYLKQDWKRMIDLVKVGLENGVKKI